MTIDPREAAQWLSEYIGPIPEKYRSDGEKRALIVARALLAGPSPAIREALEQIAACHLGDCPAAMDELSHRSAHIFRLRMIATAALSPPEGKGSIT